MFTQYRLTIPRCDFRIKTGPFGNFQQRVRRCGTIRAKSAPFSVHGVTPTMVEDDYVGGYQIYDITSEGVTLRKDGEKITLTMTENKLDITDEEE